MSQLNRSSAVCAAALLLACGLAMPAAAAEIKVLNANAMTIAMKEIAADFTKQTGHQVTFAGVSPGQVDQRFEAGQIYHIVIHPTPSGAAYEKDRTLPPRTAPPL